MTVVYRFFDAQGELLYVGMASSMIRRLAQHEYRSAWFGDVARIETETYPSRAAAQARERHLIREQNPKHNIYRYDSTVVSYVLPKRLSKAVARHAIDAELKSKSAAAAELIERGLSSVSSAPEPERVPA